MLNAKTVILVQFHLMYAQKCFAANKALIFHAQHYVIKPGWKKNHSKQQRKQYDYTSTFTTKQGKQNRSTEYQLEYTHYIIRRYFSTKYIL